MCMAVPHVHTLSQSIKKLPVARSSLEIMERTVTLQHFVLELYNHPAGVTVGINVHINKGVEVSSKQSGVSVMYCICQ